MYLIQINTWKIWRKRKWREAKFFLDSWDYEGSSHKYPNSYPNDSWDYEGSSRTLEWQRKARPYLFFQTLVVFPSQVICREFLKVVVYFRSLNKINYFLFHFTLSNIFEIYKYLNYGEMIHTLNLFSENLTLNLPVNYSVWSHKIRVSCQT